MAHKYPGVERFNIDLSNYGNILLMVIGKSQGGAQFKSGDLSYGNFRHPVRLAARELQPKQR
jgi:hypothetical protein